MLIPVEADGFQDLYGDMQHVACRPRAMQEYFSSRPVFFQLNIYGAVESRSNFTTLISPSTLNNDIL